MRKIRVGDYTYDITNFKHPGGNVIYYYNENQDAAQAFDEFHYRSKKAALVLKSLPHVLTKSQNKDDKEMLDDFAIFRNLLEDRGMFQPNYLHVSYRIVELIGLYFLATLLIKYNVLISIFLFGVFGGRCGWIQHEGGHNSLTGIINVDKTIQNVFIGFGTFVDGSMWNSMHNRHHATPQKIGHDIDLDTAPLVAFYEGAMKNGPINKINKIWLKYQAYTFLPITSGVFVMLFWVLYLHPRKIIRDKNIVQALLVLSGHITRISLFVKYANVNLYYALLYHFLALWITGIYLFGQFSLSHSFCPTVEENENPNWVRYAIEHTVDIEPENKYVGWIMGYLNNQVIHHLFPSMPQYRGPEVSKELMVFCKKWDIKYNIVTYAEAWSQMFKNLETVGSKIADA